MLSKPSSILLTFALTWVSLPAEVSFNFEVRPILSKNCIGCHGPDPEDRKGDLRLDTYEGATAMVKGLAAIVPHEPGKSTLMERIRTDDPDDVMPPPEHGHSLSDEQILLLETWIQEGANYETHWSFAPVTQHELPKLQDQDWAENPIDSFVLAKLEAAGLSPSEPADAVEFLRRLSLDLVGLPPSVEEVKAFQIAYEKKPSQAVSDAAERLLASPNYGEHWASMWLDMARYADTVGYAGDEHRDIWPWRDWVIEAYNTNKPYDEFIVEQVAGDLLPDATDQQKLATAFHRLTMNNNEGGTNDEEFRSIAVKDRLSTTINTAMGLTVRCAECHTHKYDPISHEEYYQLYAFFNQTADSDRSDDYPRMEVTPKQFPEPLSVPIAQDLPADQQRETRIMSRGSFLQLGERVSPALPVAFGSLPEGTPRNRLGLAQWLVADDNPLTARVAVNRYWARLFGIGIVETEEDFGTQGTLPSHPELLDWLASDFRKGGWDTKRLLKTLVTSAAYRQSAVTTPERLEKDPRNILVSRGPRFRLTAEVVRDQALAASGLLTNQLYGEPVYPPSPVKTFTNAFSGSTVWEESTGPDRYRRAIYTYLKRSNPHPLFETFDMSTRDVCVLRRFRTNTPLQSFMTLNDPVFVEASQALARSMSEHSNDVREQVKEGYLRVILKDPTPSQLQAFEELYHETLLDYRDRTEEALKLAGSTPTPATKENAAELATLTVLANVMLNLDAFLCK